jgi:1-aminocyclopropane-1-carboxylate deaminase
LKCRYGDFYLLPEGGTNTLAVQGCEEILTKQDVQFDYICSCVGTGGTLAGLINSIQEPQKILGFPALKGDFLQDEIQQLVGDKDHWELITDYHFGGYAKYSDKLIEFLNEFREQTSIPLDPIYTGKMMFGVLDMIAKNRFPIGSKILVIHTGGLQGISGFNQRLKNKGSKLRIGQ